MSLATVPMMLVGKLIFFELSVGAELALNSNNNTTNSRCQPHSM